MSLMMDDNLAGSGNTITEVASVSRRRRRGSRSIALRSAKPTLQASDTPSIPSRYWPSCSPRVSFPTSRGRDVGRNRDGGVAAQARRPGEEHQEEILHVHQGESRLLKYTRLDWGSPSPPLLPSTHVTYTQNVSHLRSLTPCQRRRASSRRPHARRTIRRASWRTTTWSTSPPRTERFGLGRRALWTFTTRF